MRSVAYVSELDQDECLRRLKRHVLRRSWWTPYEEGTIDTRVRGHRFRVYAWGPVNLRNSFSPIFYGRLEPRATGTRIRGRFQMHPLVRLFLTFWFGAAAFIASTPFVGKGAQQNTNLPDVIWIIAVTVIVLFGVGVVMGGKWFARFQLQDLGLFLERELQARLLRDKTSEPGGTANRSQPVGPETNRTSAAAGSGG